MAYFIQLYRKTTSFDSLLMQHLCIAAFGREYNIVNSMNVISIACNYRLGILKSF